MTKAFTSTQYIAAVGDYKTKSHRLMNRIGDEAAHFWAGFEGKPQPTFSGDKYSRQTQSAYFAAGKHFGG